MKLLKIILWLIALHSFTVAMLLIFLQEDGLHFFGFSTGNPFFQVQGGVFHIVMCVAYILAATDLQSGNRLIQFIVAAKSIAMIYLITYYTFIDPISIVLVSGLADGFMALLVFLLWNKHKSEAAHG